MKKEFLEVAAQGYYEFIAHRFRWFNRLIAFSGNDNLVDAIARLVRFFPDENVPAKQWFIDTCRVYLANPEAFLSEENANPEQYCDLWEGDSPMIEEINAFVGIKEPKTLMVFSRPFNVWMHRLLKTPDNPEFSNWFVGFVNKVGLTEQEANAEKERYSTLIQEEERIYGEIEEETKRVAA